MGVKPQGKKHVHSLYEVWAGVFVAKVHGFMIYKFSGLACLTRKSLDWVLKNVLGLHAYKSQAAAAAILCSSEALSRANTVKTKKSTICKDIAEGLSEDALNTVKLSYEVSVPNNCNYVNPCRKTNTGCFFFYPFEGKPTAFPDSGVPEEPNMGIFPLG